jgi:glycosyltransferase involved in cell wall biosynthesis
VVYELARRLDRRRFDVVGVWCLKPAEGIFVQRLTEAGIACAGASITSPLTLLPGLLRLRRMLVQARLDVLNAHLFHAGLAARLLSGWCVAGRNVISCHFAEHRHWRWLLERALPAPAALTAVSETVAKCACRGLAMPEGAVRVIYNGLDFSSLPEMDGRFRAAARAGLGLPAEAVVLGTIGRLVRVKNPLTILDAFNRLAQEIPSVYLVMTGDGPLRGELAARAEAMGISARVRLTGFLPDVSRVLAALDIFLLASDTEGHPLALVEAMAAGLPIVAARIPAVEETLGCEGAAGLLYRPGDGAGLVTHLRRLIADGEMRRKLGAAARDVAQRRFPITGMVEAYESVFAGVLAGQ